MKRKKKKGIALVSVLLILTALMVMTMGFAAFTTSDHAISQAYYSSTVTFYLAQAGLEYFHFLLRHNMLVYPIRTSTGEQGHEYDSFNSYGECVNVFDTGEEHLIIANNLNFGNVGEMFNTNAYVGTFQIEAVETPEDHPSGAADRVLYVESVGKIKEIPANIQSAFPDPSTWPATGVDFEDAAWTVKAQKTLVMRVPLKQLSPMRARYGTVNVQFEVINDAWYERFR